jgi:hypothetical protein
MNERTYAHWDYNLAKTIQVWVGRVVTTYVHMTHNDRPYEDFSWLS